jgi:hypothetical protein
MNIKQALKLKNKLKGKIRVTMSRLRRYNLYAENLERPYDARVLLKELEDLTKELIDLKSRIAEANRPIQKQIYRLSELKGMCSELSALSCEKHYSYESRETPVLKVPVIELQEKDQMVLALELEIESIQDQLDHFNHVTTV